MSPKTLAFINDRIDPDWERSIQADLVEVLGLRLDVAHYAYDRLEPGVTIEADLVLVTRQSRVATLKAHVSEPGRIMVLDRTLRRLALEPIFAIPAGTVVLVVNDSEATTLETIGLFMQLDIRHIQFMPYQKGMDCSAFQYAITPGEPGLVPRSIPTVIDVGHRCIDISSFVEIIRRLGITGHEVDRRLLRYSEQIITLDRGVDTQYKDLFLKNVQLNAVINLSREGVLLLNPQRQIVLYNRALATMLGLSRDLTGAPLDRLPAAFAAVLEPTTDQEWLLDYRGRTLVVTRQTVEHFGETTGTCFNVQEVSYLRQLEQNLSRKLQDSGLTARYRFSEVLAGSPRMKRCIELAERIAGSDLTVLITGESGTGKELLAQSIHNASARHHFPFVAVNCAAMPENLLESEMFGYEGGSFTGALKDGKIGLFEQANNGTIFLDELADMPPMLQAKLLRVLQERQIMRLGSQRVINVNIRVIAATNRNLRRLVEDGQFREDLYYRLNAVTLKVPPLRERREDILALLKDVLAAQGRPDLHLAPEAERALLAYPWPGNVRELRNIAQYLAYMAPERIALGDLPDDLVADGDGDFNQEEEALAAQGGMARARAILGVLLDLSLKEDRGAGRKGLEDALAAKGRRYSEGEVRASLRHLKELGLVQSGPGRLGSAITSRGRLFLEWSEARGRTRVPSGRRS
jgi:transcriptional regulator with PAS, ATPase and Fis domain